MFCWPCISIHPCHENQLDALFITSLFRHSTSTCFGHVCSASSGGRLYIHSNWYVLCFLVGCLLSWLGWNFPTQPGIQLTRKNNKYQLLCIYCVVASWNVMAHAQKPDFVFRRNGRVHLNRRGASVQSTTGSRGVRISGSNAGYTMFRGSVKGTGYPLHSPVSPSVPLPCVTVCHHISTGVYLLMMGYKHARNM